MNSRPGGLGREERDEGREWGRNQTLRERERLTLNQRSRLFLIKGPREAFLRSG